MNKWFGWLIAGYCGGIFWLSSGPAPTPKSLQFFNSDKLIHAAVYGLLAWLVCEGLYRSGRAWSRRALWLIPIGFTCLYGASDEIHQFFVPTRSCDPFDWLADSLGALLAVALWQGIYRSFRKPSTKMEPFTEPQG